MGCEEPIGFKHFIIDTTTKDIRMRLFRFLVY